jgi:thioredoxin-related protein
MKRVLFFAVPVIMLSVVLLAWKKTPAPAPTAEGIHWITSIDELQAKMRANPKKVYWDIYTDWCGWCKKMDATTFQNPDLIKYMNNNFYAVRFNAETQEVIHFQGKDYSFNPQFKANTLAVELMKGGQMSYPTAIFMMENFQNPNPIPGYRTVPELETMLTYFGDNAFKHKAWDAYQKEYKPMWDHGAAQDMTAPPHASPESPMGH